MLFGYEALLLLCKPGLLWNRLTGKLPMHIRTGASGPGRDGRARRLVFVLISCIHFVYCCIMFDIFCFILLYFAIYLLYVCYIFFFVAIFLICGVGLDMRPCQPGLLWNRLTGKMPMHIRKLADIEICCPPTTLPCRN